MGVDNMYKTKGEVWKAFHNGELAEWELKPILERIEFEENLSAVGKAALEYMEEKKKLTRS